jgi:hypothetical protein
LNWVQYQISLGIEIGHNTNFVASMYLGLNLESGRGTGPLAMAKERDGQRATGHGEEGTLCWSRGA